jgi:UDP-N-acetylglucosamine--N-acetylmuramyl-(pentapeptide) pyrophosphoryl-undecaprenol N-acetylglucosamine transferase
VGGSQGAKGLNEAVVELVKKTPAWQFIHLTGTKWFDTLKGAYQNCPNVRVLAYSHEIYALMKTCDLTICRSGAGTVAELIACHLPAILVPFPHATADHQYYNAKVIADSGAAEIIRENPSLAQQLYVSLSEKTPERLSLMRNAYEKVPVDPIHATEKIIQLLIRL